MQDIAGAGLRGRAAPVLRGQHRAGIAEILATYRAQGIRRLVALRGDLPSGTATAGEFRYASELVSFIRETQGGDWHIEVAAYPEYHPQQRYAQRDLEHFAHKVKAGADSAITQFFFNPDAYFHFVGRGARAGRRRAHRAGHHALPQLRAGSRSSRRATASRSRAGWR